MFLQCRQRRAAIQMLEKENLRASQDNLNNAGCEVEVNHGVGAEAVFTSSVDNLLSLEKSTEENTYDSLQPETKVEESAYDTLNPRTKAQENDYDVLPRFKTNLQH